MFRNHQIEDSSSTRYDNYPDKEDVQLWNCNHTDNFFPEFLPDYILSIPESYQMRRSAEQATLVSFWNNRKILIKHQPGICKRLCTHVAITDVI